MDTGRLYSLKSTEGSEDDKRHVGVIAQDVQKVLPEAVTVGKDDEKTLAVAYGNMVALLVEGIKDLRAENATLRADVELLKSKLTKEKN